MRTYGEGFYEINGSPVVVENGAYVTCPHNATVKKYDSIQELIEDHPEYADDGIEEP